MSTNTTRSNIDTLLDNLNDNIRKLNDNLVRTQQQNLVIDVNEFAWTNNDTSLNLPKRSRGAVKITALFALFTSNATITLGGHVYNIPAAQSPFALGGLAIVLNQSDIRNISQVTQGAMSLELFGQEYGDIGVL